MTKNYNLPVLDENPHTIIGVTPDATPEEIRAAYLNKIKEYPPERFAAEFERIRDAYAILRDARDRSRLMLQSINPEAPLETLLDHRKQTRHFVGPEAWLAAMRER
jgi:DnaJ-domain-containing protein 1